MSSRRDRSHGDDPSAEGTVSGSDGTIIVGIPAYNEGITIGSVVLQSRRHADEVIVVDDGSSDDTVSVAEESGATVIEHGENRGKGQAVRTLLGHVQDIDLDAFVLLDGDGQHLPRDIPQVAAPVEEVSIDVRYEDLDGQTHHPLRHGLVVATFVLQLIRDRRPLVFLGLPAAVLLLLGGIGMIHSVHLDQSNGTVHQWRALASGFALRVGTIALFCGLPLSQIRSMFHTIDE